MTHPSRASAIAGSGGSGGSGAFFGGALDWIVPGLGLAGGLLDGLFGGSQESMQRELLGKGVGTLEHAIGLIPGMESGVLGQIDLANMILDGIEPAVLNGIGESGRVRIAQQVMRSQQERAMQDQRLASAGLDATTVAPQVQRGHAFSDAQIAANINAEFAGIQSNAIMQSRSMAAQGRMAAAGAMERYDDRELGMRQQVANMYYGTQVAPEPPVYGSIASSVADSLHTRELLNYLRTA